MSAEEEIVNELKSIFGEKILEYKTQKRRIFIKVPPASYKDVVKYLVVSKGIYHLETITGTELKDAIEIMAHLGLDTSISVRTAIGKENPKIASIYDLIPGAEFYEREIYELLGVIFEGNPNLARFVLSDDWPENVHPLRKSFETKSKAPLREGFD